MNLAKSLFVYFFVSILWSISLIGSSNDRGPRDVFVDLIQAEKSQQSLLLDEMGQFGDPIISKIYDDWRRGRVFSFGEGKDKKIIFIDGENICYSLLTGEKLVFEDSDIEQFKKERIARALRKQFKGIIDTLGLKSSDYKTRIKSAIKLGRSQKAEYIVPLEKRLAIETDPKVASAIEEALSINLLKNGDKSQVLNSVIKLAELKSIPAKDFIEKILINETNEGRENEPLALACNASILAIESHINTIEFFGSFFRGLSTGSVLLIVSFGLAITFGLMGVINMAHGEFVAIGGYVTYLVQSAFISIWGLDHPMFGWYFLLAFPISFCVAALIGILVEKGIIRFLYRRPLESLLCTWGLSMVMQQVFRLVFGAANVQVNNPSWLMGSLNFGGFSMSFTRLLIIALALLVILLTWALLQRTNLGLHIRAVMQNRNMASSLGIPESKVNSITFSLGCGLAALGGAALSQIGNVGPSMGQAYIVDSFMVVVIGSVGNLIGAGLSAMGIGMVDQMLQPYVGPVMGKITVFFIIILFLQWKPGGIFPTKSRSLDD